MTRGCSCNGFSVGANIERSTEIDEFLTSYDINYPGFANYLYDLGIDRTEDIQYIEDILMDDTRIHGLDEQQKK